MYLARMICTDVACAAEALVEALDVMELATVLCDSCGCVMDVRGLPDWLDDELPEPLMLPRRGFGELDLAA